MMVPWLKNIKPTTIIPSFGIKDNSVHLHECSPFCAGIFVTFNKENYHVYCLCRVAHCD